MPLTDRPATDLSHSIQFFIMNNLRLLTGLISATLLSAGSYVHADTPRVVTLEEIFETAERNSAQLRPLLTAEMEADQEIKVARTSRLPEISGSLSLSYIGDGFTTKRDFSDYQTAPIPHFANSVAVNISQPVYAGGAITNSIKLAELKSTAARFATDMQRDNLRFRLTGLYLDIYKYTNLREVIENNLNQARKMLEEMNVRYNEGVALKNDITRYELLVSNLELQLIKIDNTLEILNNNLVVTAGIPEGTHVVPDSTLLSRALPTDGEALWQTIAHENSPTLQLARQEVSISRKAEDLARSEKLPKIGLQASWVMDGPILVEVPPINRNLSYWYVGVGISYNLSSVFKTDKKMTARRIATRRAEEDLEAARENVRIAVNTDYTRYMESYEDLKTQLKSVELAERNYHTISTRYSADMALITDLLDAVNSKIEAEQQLVNARINIIYFYYKLLFTSGKIS